MRRGYPHEVFNSLSMPSSTIQSFKPTSFLDRGVAIPFTTPMLNGTRARPSDRNRLDLIVPNPSGGLGCYIVAWNSMRTLSAPTVFDLRLSARIADLRSLSPASVRQATLAIAQDGYAGRAAASAAQAAAAADRDARVVTNFALLLRLVQEAEPSNPGAKPPEQEQPADLQRRARRTITELAPRVRMDNAAIAAALEELAKLFEPIGLRERTKSARLPALIMGLGQMRQQLANLPIEGEDAASLTIPLLRAVDCTLMCVKTTLTDARNKADNLVDLLVAWRTDPASVTAQLSRTDWLLNGWARIHRLWSGAADAADRRDALEEMLRLLPEMPQEAAEWGGVPLDAEPPSATSSPRLVKHEDWRNGLGFHDVVARNELLLVHS